MQVQYKANPHFKLIGHANNKNNVKKIPYHAYYNTLMHNSLQVCYNPFLFYMIKYNKL